MSDRTPNTHTVRHGWIMGHPFPLSTDIDDRGAEFDRWLAEHDRQVAERAWDEGYEAAAEFHEGREKGHWENDFPTKGMRTWRPDPAPTSPYRAAKGEQSNA